MIIVYDKETGDIIRTCSVVSQEQIDEIESTQDFIITDKPESVSPSRQRVNKGKLISIPKEEIEQRGSKIEQVKEKSYIETLEERIAELEKKVG